MHIHLDTTLLIAQRHDRADVFLRHVKVYRHDRFADFLDSGRVGHLGRIVHHQHVAVFQDHFIHDRRSRCDQVHAEFALQSFLNDFHMQKTKETAPETEAQRLRHFWFVLQGRIVQLQFFQRIAQGVVLVGFNRE